MFERYLLKSIHYDEAVIQIFRPSWLHYRLPLVLYAGIIIVALFFFYPLQTFGRWGVAVFLFVSITTLLAFIRLAIIRSLNLFVLTNQRIIDCDQRGVFERHVSECPLENIRDIRYNKIGIVRTVFNVGTVIIETGADRGHIECQDVHNPESVKELLVRVAHHSKKKSNTQDQSLI